MQLPTRNSKPDYNIPIWNETDFYWDDLNIASINLRDLIPTNRGKWNGCMWHGRIWQGHCFEGFSMRMQEQLAGQTVLETFVHDQELEEWHPSYNITAPRWNPETPNVVVPSWTYRSWNHDGFESMWVTIHNDIGLTIQEINDAMKAV